MRTPESAAAHALDLEMARREFALEMAMEHEIACLEAGYADSEASEIVEAAEEFYSFLIGEEDLPEPTTTILFGEGVTMSMAIDKFDPELLDLLYGKS